MKKIIIFLLSSLFIITLTACKSEKVNDNAVPVAEYKFEQNFHSTGGKYALTPYGDLSFSQTGIADNALMLKGGYILLSESDKIALKDAFTYSAWVKINDFASYNPLLFGNESSTGDISGGPLSIYFNENYTTLQCDITFNAGDEYKSHSFISANSLNTDMLVSQWRHIAVTFSGETLRMYLDGKKIYDGTLPKDVGRYKTIASNSKPYTIGRSTYRNFDGSIDEVRIYDVAVSGDKINSIYQEKMSYYKNKMVIKKDSNEITINGEKKVLSAPITSDYFYERLLAPAKALCDQMGATLTWDGEDGLGRIDLSFKGHNASFWILNSNASFDGTHMKIEPYPQTINDIAYIPLAPMLDSIGGIINYNTEDETYTIYY